MVSSTDLGVCLAIESVLPEELVKAVKRVDVRPGWGGALVVDVACTMDRLVGEYRCEIIDAVASVSGNTRIFLRIADR